MTAEIKPDGYIFESWRHDLEYEDGTYLYGAPDAEFPNLKPVNIVEHEEYKKLRKLEAWAERWSHGSNHVCADMTNEYDAIMGEKGK